MEPSASPQMLRGDRMRLTGSMFLCDAHGGADDFYKDSRKQWTIWLFVRHWCGFSGRKDDIPSIYTKRLSRFSYFLPKIEEFSMTVLLFSLLMFDYMNKDNNMKKPLNKTFSWIQNVCYNQGMFLKEDQKHNTCNIDHDGNW